jgi:hypothetical protein
VKLIYFQTVIKHVLQYACSHKQFLQAHFREKGDRREGPGRKESRLVQHDAWWIGQGVVNSPDLSVSSVSSGEYRLISYRTFPFKCYPDHLLVRTSLEIVVGAWHRRHASPQTMMPPLLMLLQVEVHRAEPSCKALMTSWFLMLGLLELRV